MSALRKLLFVLVSAAISPISFATDALPRPEPSFKGSIAISAKDSVPDWAQPVQAQGAPNIVLILLDDAGYAQTSTFGGLTQTPALDQLAAQGLRYTRFHVTAVCSPTRAALLTGRNHHRVGFGSLNGGAGYPGYDAIWKKETVSVAEVLRRNGYSTAAFGKWHNTLVADISPVGPFDRWPTGLGFEYFYGIMIGESSQWEPPLYRNTIPVEPPATPEGGYHFTTDITNEAINWVRTHRSLAQDKPYFVYFATCATHVPHHVPKEWIDKYRGQFDRGWDVLREEVFARQKALGVIPTNAELTPRPKGLPAWNSLSSEQKQLLAHQMEVAAGYLAQTDYEIGRLLKVIQQGPGSDNTLILYIAGDNGASAMEGIYGNDDREAPPETVQTRLKQMEELGGPKHDNGYGAAWAWVNNTPFLGMKLDAAHFGGTRDPLIVSWPAKIKDRGGLRDQFTHVNDVAATLYEVSGIHFPEVVNDAQQVPLDGSSFADSFTDPSAPSHHPIQYFENWGNRAIYKDGWVAAARHYLPWGPFVPSSDFEHDRWELYYIDTDFSEAHDLAARYPDKLKELKGLFDTEARANQVYPLGGSDSIPLSTTEKGREIVYYPSLPRIPASAAPDFLQSHRIVAQVNIPDAGAEGVILTDGDRFGGFSLYVKDDRLVYEENYPGRSHTVLTSDATLPRGRMELTFEFIRDRATAAGVGSQEVSGTGLLYVNGRKVGEGQVNMGFLVDDYGATFNVGTARVSSVSSAYAIPYKFTGTLEQVKVVLN